LYKWTAVGWLFLLLPILPACALPNAPGGGRAEGKVRFLDSGQQRGGAERWAKVSASSRRCTVRLA